MVEPASFSEADNAGDMNNPAGFYDFMIRASGGLHRSSRLIERWKGSSLSRAGLQSRSRSHRRVTQDQQPDEADVVNLNSPPVDESVSAVAEPVVDNPGATGKV